MYKTRDGRRETKISEPLSVNSVEKRMFTVALLFAIFGQFKGTHGQIDSLIGSMFEEMMTLKDEINALKLQVQELQLTSDSCTCDDSSNYGM